MASCTLLFREKEVCGLQEASAGFPQASGTSKPFKKGTLLFFKKFLALLSLCIHCNSGSTFHQQLLVLLAAWNLFPALTAQCGIGFDVGIVVAVVVVVTVLT